MHIHQAAAQGIPINITDALALSQFAEGQ